MPGALFDRYQPATVIIVAGAAPLMRPLHQHTWGTFSANWNLDVRVAFPLGARSVAHPAAARRPGHRRQQRGGACRIPLSGGYAEAKATQRFITGYAPEESERAGLGIAFTAVLPQLTPATVLGLPAVRAYAARSGHSVEQYLAQLGEPLTPDAAGAALLTLARIPTADLAAAYRLTAAGLTAPRAHGGDPGRGRRFTVA